MKAITHGFAADGALTCRPEEAQTLLSVLWKWRWPGFRSPAAWLALVIAVALCQDSVAQSRLLSYRSGDATVREWNVTTGAYMSNVLTLLTGVGGPFTDQSGGRGCDG